ncbi:hypothetical protein MA16_Dca026352 [Dendrobium catenatum]|uniref:Uncharacterized protein n=1 Tax=Dendrobium catenatum TaxID=906689 RepID=A0A2I0VRS3_9ASPA|nr:hypothetical protein MA16_Dca026352 [Dendrobium catenatum]
MVPLDFELVTKDWITSGGEQITINYLSKTSSLRQDVGTGCRTLSTMSGLQQDVRT